MSVASPEHDLTRGPDAGDLPLPSLALVILDGWGIAPPGPGNAVELANTPVFDMLWKSYPHTQLTACGQAVGLPEGQMGNSEVGHLNLGAGSIIKQDLATIDDAISSGGFVQNPSLVEACVRARNGTGRLHLMGLVSGGGVHSSLSHLQAMIELAAAQNVPEVVLHAFTDGRDTAPDSAPGFVSQVEDWLVAAGSRGTSASIATVSGRYFAMDRDKRWDRVKRAYDAIVHGMGERADTPQQAIELAYERGETDEFITPTVIGKPPTVEDGDTIVMFNFRPDRMREITRALGEPDFKEFDRGRAPSVGITTMTSYQEEWGYPIAFVPARPGVTVADVIAERGERQLHVAETEKYAHVTYFFNGGVEHEHSGEERCLVASPRDVPTYDHKPEMSAPNAATEFASRWRKASAAGDPYRFGIINFANPDMVGHTGSIPAAVQAVETVDHCLGEVTSAVLAVGGGLIITADHGNAEQMLTADGSPDTAHSLNPVPLAVTVHDLSLRDGGVLADVIPTALKLLGIAQPDEMTGEALSLG